MSRQRQDRCLFNRIARRYARKDVCPSSSLARQAQLLSALKPLLDERPTLGTVVDIGCGVGAPARYLQGCYEHYTGIDQSEQMIEAAALFNQDNGRAEFIAGNVKSRELPHGVADVILSIGALHHMTELDDVLSSLTRLAKPRAFLIVVEPQDGNPLIQAARCVRGLLDPGYSRQQVFFSERELVELLAAGGITVLSVAFQGFLTPPFAQVVIQPQIFSVPLSRFAVRADSWLDDRLPDFLKKLSFNVVIIGRFEG
ncbi:MAG: class I SAM-dependent methyltransferase [Anaerolineae bacterium]